MDKSAAPRVAVFGHSKPDEATRALAERVGQWLAARGYTVVNGGYGGTMAAAAKGARSRGGEVIGVTCGIWPTPANEYVTREVATKDLFGRLTTLMDLGAAGFVVLPGGTGTLLELAAAWETLNKHLAADRPLVCVGEFWRPIVERVVQGQPKAAATIRFAADVEDLGAVFNPVRDSES